ncbi:hypothetical protein J437_LFUL015510 [Ladona fulva]|uniref:PHD-type domain-containing protein n=1 Tax=Ladona fulva TaxID=123851 RepID=A0A8K0KI29_LADFU|nr:hypothetical protein J437_LFUL015510 [Ladona fulva]
MNVTSEAGSAVGETNMCRKVRSSEEPPIETSPQEMSYRLKLYPDVSKVLKEKIRCTACATPMLKEVMTNRNVFFHPILQVLFCKDCRGFYGDGDFPLDEDNSDTYCRWCAQGGNLYCCSSCNFVFCRPCIRRNFRQSMLEEIEEEDWNCFVCNPEALWKQRAICWAVREFSKSRPKVSSNSESSDEDSTKTRRERSWKNDSKRRGKKNTWDDDKQKKRKRRSKRYEVSESGDSSQERTDGKKKAVEKKEADEDRKNDKERRDEEEREDDEERKDEDKSTAELRKIRLPKVRKDIEDDVSTVLDLEVDPRKMAVMKKTCLSMEKLTKSAQHVTNTGARKMHELHAWISGKNASPRKQQQLSPTKLKKMITSFSKIVHGLKENAEELERRVHAVEEEWVSVFEEGSKEMEKMQNGEGGEVGNEDVEKDGEKVNVPENVNDTTEAVNGLDVSSNIGNISLDETIPLDENECQLEVKDQKNVSDAETVVIDSNAVDVTEENDQVEEEDKDNHREDNAEREPAKEAEKRTEETEVHESSKITNGSLSDQNNESSKLNVSLDIFGDEEIPPSSPIVPSEGDEEKAESVAPPICEDLGSEMENIGKDGGKNEEKRNLCTKAPAEENVGDVVMNNIDGNTDVETDIGDGDEKEVSKDAFKKKADEVEHSCQENKENIKPSKDDRDAKLEFLLDSSSSEESDNKLVDKVRKGRGKVEVVADSDSTDSSDSDSEAARKIKKDRRKNKHSEVPPEKLIETELVAQFDDEKLKKGCSVVVEKLGKSDTIEDEIGKKSAKDQGKKEDDIEKAIKRLANLTSLEKPWKSKENNSNSDSGSNDEKKTKRPALKSGLEKKRESPEEDQSDEAPHISTDELEMELKTVSKTEDSKMDEMAKNILVKDSSDSDSDFYLSADEKKERLKRKKAEKPENPKSEKEDSDDDFEMKPSKKSWRNNRLLTAKLSETDSSEEERRFKKKKKRLESDSDEEVESKVKSSML